MGHVEWVQFARVESLPAAGQIVHAEHWWDEPGGGGAVAAGELRRLAGTCLFMTALGQGGEPGRDALADAGIDVEVAWRTEQQRRKIALLDAAGERTLTVLGSRLVPHGADDLPWDALGGCDAVYFTGGDAEALRAARAARVLVATPRAQPVLSEAGVFLDALVGSSTDAGEAYSPGDISPAPGLVVLTNGSAGGTWVRDSGSGSYAAVAPPGEVVDAYGCGDCFAAGLTWALGHGMELADALRIAAASGAGALARPGAGLTTG